MPSEIVRRALNRALNLFRHGRAESELAREIKAHLQLLEDQFVERGMPREDARYAARRTFGGVEQVKELQRDERTLRWLTGWPIDLKLGARMLVKSPGLTVIAVVALAIAIGAGAAYIEFTRDLLNPRLPGPYGDRIVGIRIYDAGRRAPEPYTVDQFTRWRNHASLIEELGGVRFLDRELISSDARTERARAVEITASAFRLFPTAPMLGRTLVDRDEAPGAPPVVVIGEDLWIGRFDADPNILARTIRIGPLAHTIVGVMPKAFGFPANENLWAPLKVDAAAVKPGESFVTRVFGRLRQGETIESAQAQLAGMLPGSAEHVRPEVRRYVDSLLSAESTREKVVAVLYSINLVFVMLLGICAANVATLVFARTAMREAEITVRSALGASRGRICAQLFAEALVLSSLAGGAGLLVARAGGRWVTRMFTESTGQPVPFWWNDSLSPETILYTAALAVFSALIVGVIPALKATGAQLQGRLREAGAAGSSMKFGRLWTSVIVMQAAITVMFLATVVSLGWTALRAQYSLDVTYPRGQLLTARVEPDAPASGPGPPRYADAATLDAIVTRLRAEPGVVNASYTTSLPGTTWEQFMIELATPELAANARFVTDVPWTESARVGPNFFETIGTPLVAGRFFTDAEIRRGHHVAIVDESFVRLIFGGRNPLGVMVRQRAGDGAGVPGPWHEIVGVVKDVTVMKRKGPDDTVLYRPAGDDAAAALRLVVRTQGDAVPMSRTLQAAALSAKSDIHLFGVMTMDQVARGEALPMRFFLRVFAVISAVALLLSTAGIYALISFTLARRTREIGIRVALGAAPRRIITSVFSRAFMQIGLGVLVGALPSAVIVISGVEDSGGVEPTAGVAIIAAVCAFVVGVALVSCATPLRRALTIEPTHALRADA